MPENEGISLAARLLNQFPALDLTLWLHEGARDIPFEPIAIGLTLILNAGLGAYQESKAEEALTRLKALAMPAAWVRRDGALVQVPAQEIVPGDVARVEAGDRVPADGRLVEGQGVAADESMLTGESLPVEKKLEAELFSGTLVVRGDHDCNVAQGSRRKAPMSKLLDRDSFRFIVISASIKAGVGIGFLVLMPLLGYGLEETRTAVFLYESIMQLPFVYPCRRISVHCQIGGSTGPWAVACLASAYDACSTLQNHAGVGTPERGCVLGACHNGRPHLGGSAVGQPLSRESKYYQLSSLEAGPR